MGWLPLAFPLLGIESATRGCALDQESHHDLLVHGWSFHPWATLVGMFWLLLLRNELSPNITGM